MKLHNGETEEHLEFVQSVYNSVREALVTERDGDLLCLPEKVADLFGGTGDKLIRWCMIEVREATLGVEPSKRLQVAENAIWNAMEDMKVVRRAIALLADDGEGE